MGFRFFRRIRLAPGLTLNLSKSGGSLSFGRRGARLTLGQRGVRSTVGIPGTGMFYTETYSPRGRGRAHGRRRGRQSASVPVDKPATSADRLTLGFFKRLVTPAGEEAFVDGCRALYQGSEATALKHLRRSTHVDGAFLAGMLSLKSSRFADAAGFFVVARSEPRKLGQLFRKYGLSATAALPITDQVTAHVGVNTQGVLLGLVEAHQGMKQWDRAVECLERLRRLAPTDPVVILSLVELISDAAPQSRKMCRRVVSLAKDVKNETPIHTAILLYKARALRTLGLYTAARDVLTLSLRRRKNRPPDLLRALRYERALVYENLGQSKRAHSELERIYAEQPDYEDVAVRLGL